MVFQNALIDLAKDKELTLEPKNVLLFLLGRLDFENFIYVSQQEIATELNMSTSHVSRAIKALAMKQIVLTAPLKGRLKCYRLNPNYGWKGKVKNFEDFKRDHLKLIRGGKDE